MSAFELFHRREPYFGEFRKFGTKCTILDQRPSRKKFDPTGIEAILVGLNSGVFGYRVWIPGTRKIIVTKNITFEKEAPLESAIKPHISSNDTDNIFMKENDHDSPTEDVDNTEPPTNQPSYPDDDTPPAESDKDSSAAAGPATSPNDRDDAPMTEGRSTQSIRPTDPRRSEDDSPQVESMPESSTSDPNVEKKRKKKVYKASAEKLASLRDRSTLKPPARYEAGLALANACESQVIEEPDCYTSAMKSNHKAEWIAAMEEELHNMDLLGVWSLVPLPPGRKAIKSRWVFRVKTVPELRFRARLVLCGYSQRAGIDYDALFSPTVKFETIRCLLNIAAREELTVWQADVKCAFLTADIDSELYMALPEGYHTTERNVVCRLNRALYGAKQSNRCFYQKMKELLLTLGLQQSSADPCVFRGDDNQRLFLAIYVDDSIIMAKSEHAIKDLLDKLGAHLELTSRPLNSFLGIQVEQLDDGLFLHQTRFVDNVLERFGMTDCKPSSSPLDRSIFSSDETEEIDDSEYRSMIGSLQYLVQCTRADLAFPVSFLSRFLTKPTKKRMSELRRVFRYLKKTRNYGISYANDGDRHYQFFSDSDYGSDTITRKSVSGLMIHANGGPIFWKSTLQRSVSLSSAESELSALSALAQTAQFWSRLTGELGYTERPVLRCDNTAAIKLATDYQLNCKTKHISLRQFYVRQLVEEGSLEVLHVPSTENMADLMTKPHTPPVLKNLLQLIGIKPRNDQCSTTQS